MDNHQKLSCWSESTNRWVAKANKFEELFELFSSLIKMEISLGKVFLRISHKSFLLSLCNQESFGCITARERFSRFYKNANFFIHKFAKDNEKCFQAGTIKNNFQYPRFFWQRHFISFKSFMLLFCGEIVFILLWALTIMNVRKLFLNLWDYLRKIIRCDDVFVTLSLVCLFFWLSQQKFCVIA